MELDDDDFIYRYEGAFFLYTASWDKVLDLLLRSLPELPHKDPKSWHLMGPTSLGGGFHQQKNGLYWIYQEGLAISVTANVLNERIYTRENRERFYAIIRRWKWSR